MTITSSESRALDHLDTDGMLDFVSELVAIPSLGGEETPAQERVAQWMEEAGLQVDRWELDMEELRAHPAYSAEIERDRGLGVVGKLGEELGGRTLLLNGHVDVVPSGDRTQWSFPPFSGEVKGGEVRGRGALDMKGGLVAGLFAAKAILDSGVALLGSLVLESVIGEEDGGVGTLACILRGYRGDGAIIMEPTGLAICPAQAGALNFRVTVKGRSAHGCMREEGVSALEKFFPLHEELMALEARRTHNCADPLFRGFRVPFPLSVGTIEGGDWPSSVPDRIRVEGRYGVAPGEELSHAQAEFLDAVARAGARDSWLRENPPDVEWWGGRFHPARIPVDHPLVLELQDATRDQSGVPAPLAGVTYGSDMRLLVREADTPTVLFGPGDVRRAHAPDESVSVEKLEQTAKSLILTALRFCGYEND